MASARRIGAPDAKNRGVLLDAAEQLMLEEGYAAVTSRRVAEKAGLKPQLVHYYFRTMEDLFLAVFRRSRKGLEVGAGAGIAAAAVGAVAVRHGSRGQPPDDGVHGPGQPPQGAAGRDRLLRRTFPGGAEQGDRRGAAALRRRRGEVPPVVWTVFATSVSPGLVMERALGMSTGHAETLEFCERGCAGWRGNRRRRRSLRRTQPSPVANRAERALGSLTVSTTTPSTASTQWKFGVALTRRWSP